MTSENKPGGEVVVITGASSGVGRATARCFGSKGAKVALLARGVDGLEGTRREVVDAGGEAFAQPVDVSDAGQVAAAAAAIEEELGPIDIWINNAMVTVFSEIQEMTPEEFHRVTEVTYLGTVYGTMAALKRMRPRNRGTIVQVGSALAYRSIPLQSAYCGAKHAILGFTDSLRSELIHAGSGIHVTMVQLPAINTPQFDVARSHRTRRAQPVPPIYQPEVAAGAIHWAAHNRRRELWVGSSSVQAILGNRVAPGFLDRKLATSGYADQETDEPAEAGRPDNLWEPVPGDHGAHGRFDARARSYSLQTWIAEHGQLVAAAGAAVGLGVAMAIVSSNGRKNHGSTKYE